LSSSLIPRVKFGSLSAGCARTFRILQHAKLSAESPAGAPTESVSTSAAHHSYMLALLSVILRQVSSFRAQICPLCPSSVPLIETAAMQPCSWSKGRMQLFNPVDHLNGQQRQICARKKIPGAG